MGQPVISRPAPEPMTLRDRRRGRSYMQHEGDPRDHGIQHTVMPEQYGEQ